MKKKTWLLIAGLAALLLLVLCILIGTHVICIFHEMNPATCTEPRTCRYCSYEEGAALGHKWKDATCENPQTCELCNEVTGEAMGHVWIDATCELPKTCSTCGETDGDVLEHIPGEWVYEDLDAMACTRLAVCHCTMCGRTLEQKLESMDVLYENAAFVISPAEFTERINAMFDKISDNGLKAELSTDEQDYVLCMISDRNGSVAKIYFVDTNQSMYLDKKLVNERDVFEGLICSFDTADVDRIVDTFWGIMMACDPKLDRISVMELDPIGKQCTHNGIRYMLGALTKDMYAFYVVLIK